MIYLITCKETNTCKIGYSTNVENRLKQIQAYNPLKLSLEYVIGGFVNDEKQLHRKFDKYALGREWFSCHKDIYNYFASQPSVTSDFVKEKTLYEYDEKNEYLFIEDLNNEEWAEYYKLKAIGGKVFDMKEGANRAKLNVFLRSDKFKPSSQELINIDSVFDLMP